MGMEMGMGNGEGRGKWEWEWGMGMGRDADRWDREGKGWKKREMNEKNTRNAKKKRLNLHMWEFCCIFVADFV